ncbi:uncharacterized protein [Rutidosis leptorrhynchoides]|uniref:uncharacterized protein n=1 Tax=Rutidosis leptorrhynchoides TaxID=125765 RepID=UPI003A990748
MAMQQTLFSFYKRKPDDTTININQESKCVKASTSDPKQHQNQPEINITETLDPNIRTANLNFLERDPRKRKHMWEYHVNDRELIEGKYSPTKDVVYCFQCYLFEGKQNVHNGADTFKVNGFDNWKKVHDRKKCSFLKHICGSSHKDAIVYSENLLNQASHIDTNHLRLKATVDIVRWLTFHTCAFRGHDETQNSKNRGNFLELLQFLASYNDELAKVVLENALYNSKFIAGSIQKEILGIIANKVRKHICNEVGNSYFCVMVDESRDESKKEKMAIVLRFIENDGVVRERFLDLVHVSDTTSLTLKTCLWKQLLQYDFDTSKIRSLGYDGASNMRGEWNGLQALVRKDSPYAYYVHCFAHRLQLALVAAAREVVTLHQFFSNLTFITNVICVSSKRHDELQKVKSNEIKRLLELGEIETGK